MVVTQVAAPPKAGSNREAVRHTSRRTSWATSSDWDGSRRTLRMTPYTGPAIRSYSASNAAWSPRATWMSRSSRSRSPLLSAVADRNRDASGSFGFIWHLRGRSRIGWAGSKRNSKILVTAVAWCGARSVLAAVLAAAADSPQTALGDSDRTRVRGSGPAHVGNQRYLSARKLASQSGVQEDLPALAISRREAVEAADCSQVRIFSPERSPG